MIHLKQEKENENSLFKHIHSVICQLMDRLYSITIPWFMPYISQREGSTEQQPGRDAEPPHSSGLYPPEPPCWQDQWLSKIKKTEQHLLH